MNDSYPYAPPPSLPKIEDCCFYHTTELPDIGVLPGEWDLRAGTAAYVGKVDVHGRRVLDVGAASGFVSFALERMGADVVALNLSAEHAPDLVPLAGVDLGSKLRDHRRRIEQINNAFWFAHHHHRSRVRLVHATAYDVPQAIGPVDIAMFGCVLLHLRDPFLGLASALGLTTQTAIVTEPVVLRSRLKRWVLDRFVRPAALFLPDPRQTGAPTSWWLLTPELVRRFLAVLGFENSQVTYHRQLFARQPIDMFTVVAQRTAPPA